MALAHARAELSYLAMTDARSPTLDSEAAAAVRAAFSCGPPPPLVDVLNEHCPECRATSLRVAGRRWDAIGIADLEGNTEIPLFTAVAFRYYVPIFMLVCIEEPTRADCMPLGVVERLAPKNRKPSAELAELRAKMTTAQRAAVHAFLRAMRERDPGSKPVSRALEYWAGV